MLTVDGVLDLQVEAATARLTARGSDLHFDCADLGALLRAMGQPRGGAAGGTSGALAVARAVATRLNALGLTLHLSSGGRLLLVLGQGARPGFTERFLGVPHFQLVDGGELLRLVMQQ